MTISKLQRPLFDAHTCIYVLKNRSVDLVKKSRAVGNEEVGISTITIAELEFGVAKSVRPEETISKLYGFLVPFTILDFDMHAARYYGKVRKALKDLGQPIGPMDMLISSLALAHGLTLVTHIEKVFTRVPGLKIENWISG